MIPALPRKVYIKSGNWQHKNRNDKPRKSTIAHLSSYIFSLLYSTSENAIIILTISEKISPNLVNYTETKHGKTMISNHKSRLTFQNSQTTCILPERKILNINLESSNIITALSQRRTKALLQKVAIIFSEVRNPLE